MIFENSFKLHSPEGSSNFKLRIFKYHEQGKFLTARVYVIILLLIYYMTGKITNLTLKINDRLAAISQSERRNIINCFLFVSVVSDEIFLEGEIIYSEKRRLYAVA